MKFIELGGGFLFQEAWKFVRNNKYTYMQCGKDMFLHVEDVNDEPVIEIWLNGEFEKTVNGESFDCSLSFEEILMDVWTVGQIWDLKSE